MEDYLNKSQTGKKRNFAQSYDTNVPFALIQDNELKSDFLWHNPINQ